MPFALTFVGLFMVVVGFQDTYKQAGAAISNDFTGKNNFFYWLVAIGVIGSIGYIKGAETFSRAFLGLVILTMFVSNGGFFSKLTSALSSGSTQSAQNIGTPLPEPPSSQSSSSSGGGGGMMSSLGVV